jgi:hypothetical protein
MSDFPRLIGLNIVDACPHPPEKHGIAARSNQATLVHFPRSVSFKPPTAFCTARGLVGLAFGLELRITRHFAGRLLHSAFGLLGGALD